MARREKREVLQRRRLPHDVPRWVSVDALFFITVCTVPRHQNQLCHPEVGHELRQSVLYRETLEQWQVPLLLLMPDHLHMLTRFAPEPGMSSIMTAWKRYTARHCSIMWQQDFFDYRLRDEREVQEKAHYIRMNPVRAGLVERVRDWPYLWEDRIVSSDEQDE